MTHNSRCAHANPASKCRCSCNGKLHGINYEVVKKDDTPTIDRYLMLNEKSMDNAKKFKKA